MGWSPGCFLRADALHLAVNIPTKALAQMGVLVHEFLKLCPYHRVVLFVRGCSRVCLDHLIIYHKTVSLVILTLIYISDIKHTYLKNILHGELTAQNYLIMLSELFVTASASQPLSLCPLCLQKQ